MKAVAYVRVSTSIQDEENQVKAIMDFARGRNLEIVKFYVDKEVSGSKPFKSRAAASRLLAELEQVKPDALIVFTVDRIGRDMKDALDTILSLEERGVKVISVREEWLQTLDQNIRKLILSILLWASEFEKRRLRERQEAAWNAGKRKGRPEIVLPADEILARLRGGWSKRDICEWLAREKGIRISYWQLVRKINSRLRSAQHQTKF